MKNYNPFHRFIVKWSYRQAHHHSNAKQYAAIILGATAFKISISFVSIVGAYVYIKNFFYTFNNNENIVIALTIAALILIETGVHFSLGVYWKYILQKPRILWKILIGFVLAACFLALSFFTTTMGSAMKESINVDNAVEINAKFEVLRIGINTDYETEIELLKETNDRISINPQGYSKNGGRGSRLTKRQTNEIAANNNKIMNLKNQKRAEIKNLENKRQTELKLNSINTTRQADFTESNTRYLMFFQFLLSFIITFIAIKIYQEEFKEESKQAQISQTVEKITTDINNVLHQVTTNETNIYASAIQNALINQQSVKTGTKQETESETKNKDTETNEKKPESHPIGFQSSLNQNTESLNQSTKNTLLNPCLNRGLNLENTKSLNLDQKQYLQKYSKLAEDIYNKLQSGLSIKQIYTKHDVSKSTYFNVKRIIDNLY